jgi:hypothetical protein
VFFHDIGPPWPKHSCTDNRPVPAFKCEDVTKPRLHGKDLSQELIQAAQAMARGRSRSFDRFNPEVATPVLIIAVSRTGERVDLVGEFLDSPDHASFRFTYVCADDLLQVGDVISVIEREISFIDPRTLVPIVCTDGTEPRVFLPREPMSADAKGVPPPGSLLIKKLTPASAETRGKRAPKTITITVAKRRDAATKQMPAGHERNQANSVTLALKRPDMRQAQMAVQQESEQSIEEKLSRLGRVVIGSGKV